MKTKKIIIYVLVVNSLSLFLSMNTYAVTVSPSSYTCNNGDSVDLSLTATPTTSNQNVLTLRLSADNMTITNFVPASGYAVSQGDCGSGAFYTSSTVCATLGTSPGDITTGQAVGTLTVKCSSQNGTITKTSSNQYTGTGGDVVNSGILASFNVNGSASVLPITAVSNSQNTLLLMFGTALILIGGILYFKSRQNSSSIT